MTAMKNCDELQFRALLAGLAQDVVDAHIYWNLWKGIQEKLKTSPEVYAESQTFWYYTLNAHLRTALASLAKAYDQGESSLHLRNWLDTIHANLHLFSKSAYERRLSGDPFAKWLLTDVREPDIDVLEADIKSCTKASKEVEALIKYRGGVLAHRGAKLAMNGENSKTPQLETESVELLLNRANEILNRYSILFMATAHSMTPVGHDDFRSIFHYMQSVLASDKEKINAQAASLTHDHC